MSLCFEALDRWPETQDLEKIDAMSVAALKEEGADLQAVFAKGYSLKAAHAGGFALSACLAAGIGLQECLHAGFHLPEELRMSSNKSTLDAHEMEILRRVESGLDDGYYRCHWRTCLRGCDLERFAGGLQRP